MAYHRKGEYRKFLQNPTLRIVDVLRDSGFSLDVAYSDRGMMAHHLACPDVFILSYGQRPGHLDRIMTTDGTKLDVISYKTRAKHRKKYEVRLDASSRYEIVNGRLIGSLSAENLKGVSLENLSVAILAENEECESPADIVDSFFAGRY